MSLVYQVQMLETEVTDRNQQLMRPIDLLEANCRIWVRPHSENGERPQELKGLHLQLPETEFCQ